MKYDLSEMILRAHERSYQRAFEVAVRTNTALVFTRNGKVVEVKPPYRYELVSTEPEEKKKNSLKKK